MQCFPFEAILGLRRSKSYLCLTPPRPSATDKQPHDTEIVNPPSLTDK